MSLLIFWKFGRWGRARYDSFGAALLLVGSAFRIHALLDALIYGARLDDIYRYSNVPLPDPAFEFLLKGESISVIAFLLVACSWRLRVGGDVERHSFIGNAGTAPMKISLLIYGSAFAVDILRRSAGVSFGPLDQITSLLFVAGVASIFFVAVRRKTAAGQVLVASLLALPLSLLALDSGMKEQMFFPFVPAGIVYWIRFRRPGARLPALCAAVSILAISQLYVHHVRELSWRSDGDLNIPTTELVGSFIEILAESESMDALSHISSRINMTTSHAITVSLADHYGHEPVEVFGLIPASVVPRLLWPGKPVMQPGAMHTARILGISDPLSEIRTATAAGFATELYLGGWWVGVVLGAVAYGFLLGTAQQWTSRFGPGFGRGVLCFIALYWTLRFDEKHVVYAYTSIFFAAVFIWILVRAVSVLGIRQSASAQPRWAIRQ